MHERTKALRHLWTGGRRPLALLLAVMLAIALIPVGTGQAFAAPGNWIDVADTSWYDPAEDTYSIGTPQQLAGLAKLVNNGTDTFSGKTVTLANDISLANPDGSGDAFLWTPIGTSTSVNF